MSQSQTENDFTLEELPSLLYQKLDDILAKTQYRSLQSLAGSSHEQIILISKNNPDLWLDLNDSTEDEKLFGTMDLYHLMAGENGNETKIPHLRFFCDVLFGEIKIRYLKQPQIEMCYIAEESKEGELGVYLYTLAWLIGLESKDYR